VATWGNLANRVLSFTCKYWGEQVPEPGELDADDLQLLATVEAGFESVGNELEAVHLRAALAEAMRLATEVNKYLDQKAPWKAVKEDKDKAAKSIFTALKAIDSLSILFAPFLPFSSQKLHSFLGYEDQLFGEQRVETIQDELGTHSVLRYDPAKGKGEWKPSRLTAGLRSEIDLPVGTDEHDPRAHLSRCSRNWTPALLSKSASGWDSPKKEFQKEKQPELFSGCSVLWLKYYSLFSQCT
jgi:methionyl-tRNA synthetase